MIWRLSALAISLLAFALRVFRLDGQSLWADEGASAFMTHRSVSEIIVAAAGDIHPPLYYLMLTAWTKVAGQSEFAMRYLSVIAGLLVVALCFRLGRLLLDRTTASAGAFFTAASPLLIYYSQEARMYEQMAALGTGAIVMSISAWQSAAGRDDEDVRSRSRWLDLVAAPVFALAVLSQYFGVTAMIAASLLFVLFHPNPFRQWRAWLRWAGVQIAAIVMVLPWLLYASNQLKSWSVDTEPLSAGEFLLRTVRTFSFGYAWDQTVTDKTTLLLAALFAISALWPLVTRSARFAAIRGWVATLIIAVTPPLTLFLVAINRPVYNPKFLLIALPAFGLLQGCALVAAGRVAGSVARPRSAARPVAVAVSSALLLGLLFATGRALGASYVDSKYARDDYRGLVHYIDVAGKPGDSIILNAAGQSEIFGYYYRNSFPVRGMPVARPPERAATEKELQEYLKTANRVWLVLWASEQSDPEGIVEGWLNRNAFRTSNRWYGGVRLVLYTLQGKADDGSIQVPNVHHFESGVDLLGYSLATPVSQPGEALQLSLFWKAAGPTQDRYTVFTHLIDTAELIWGQRDSEPVAGQRPTVTWTSGETIQDRYGIPVLSGTPPGDYYVELGLYRGQDGRRLGIVGSTGSVSSDRVLIGPISIGPVDRQPPVEALGIPSKADSAFGPLRLIGFDFHRLGFDTGIVDFHQGDEAHLTTFWKADQRPGKDRQLMYEVRDASGATVLKRTLDPTNGLFPTSQWSEGELVRSQQRFVLAIPPGSYRLFVGLDGDRPVETASFTVKP